MERFDRYLEHEMAEAERLDFEEKLRSDAALSESFDLHQDARLAARLDGREALKQRLRERRAASSAKPTAAAGKKWLWILGGLLGLLAVFFWWKTNQNPPVQNSPKPGQPAENNAPAEPQNLPEPAKPPQPIAENPPARSDMDKVFAANFKAYQSDEIKGMLRSDDEPDAFQNFLAAYLRGSHAEALRLFENLSEEDKSNENIQFLKTNSLLATGQAATALPILESICLDKGTRFLTEAQWLLALAYLKTGDLKNARSTLNFVKTAAGGRLPHAKQAAEILKKLPAQR